MLMRKVTIFLAQITGYVEIRSIKSLPLVTSIVLTCQLLQNSNRTPYYMCSCVLILNKLMKNNPREQILDLFQLLINTYHCLLLLKKLPLYYSLFSLRNVVSSSDSFPYSTGTYLSRKIVRAISFGWLQGNSLLGTSGLIHIEIQRLAAYIRATKIQVR